MLVFLVFCLMLQSILWICSILFVVKKVSDRLLFDSQKVQKEWNQERADLINRLQAKDLWTYQTLASASTSTLDSDGFPTGLSDEEELRRSQGTEDWRGLGEILMDQEEDLRELGVIE